jgi:hypothetical protein
MNTGWWRMSAVVVQTLAAPTSSAESQPVAVIQRGVAHAPMRALSAVSSNSGTIANGS